MFKKLPTLFITLFILLQLVSSFGFAQGSESFTNLTAATGSYGNGSFTGDNGVTWTFNQARRVIASNSDAITGTTIGFASSGTRFVSASSGSSGVGDITYTVSSYFTGGNASNRSIEVYVNGNLYESHTLAAMTTNYTNTFTANESGDVTIEFRSVGTRQIVIDDISWSALSTDTADYCNLQNPANGTVEAGEPFNIQARVYELGLTDITTGQAPDIQSWIGYSTTDATSTADFATAAWTWVPASFISETDAGANDEYQADLGSVILTPGTYYYASRFELNGGPYTYGGYSAAGGNFWDGTLNVSGELTVTPAILDFYNLQFPATGNILTGETHTVFAQAYELGVTEAAGQGAGINAWIGYSTTDATSTADFTTAAWTWVPAPYFGQAGTGNNNDDYALDLGAIIPSSGTYFYVSRFEYNFGNFTYGGFNTGGGDGAWDGTNDVSGVLTITDSPLADVVITEISYNSNGDDDEWIEICNISGSIQDISGYTIDNGSTLFTFPASTTIADSNCITIALGSSGDGTYNIDCPFTPSYGIDVSINDTNNLVNSSDTITLFAEDGIRVADVVTYDDADGADGNGATLHVVDATLINSDTGTNWQEVPTGGSPGTNSLTSPCSVPELQLVDDSNTNQNCGYTINFGSQATGFTTDVTFDIDNDGTADLNVTSLVFSGIDAADFSVVSPATPFTVTPGNSQTVTLQFAPSTLGVKNAVLTINNNDTDEGSCTIVLQGNATAPEQEINIEGDLGAFPDITNGDITPSSLDNTLFAAQNIGNSQAKSFRIQNIGTADLSVSSISVGGINPGDFTVSINPAPVTLTPLQDPPAIFEITFSPIASGTRTAIISITNDDLDQNPFTFTVEGTGLCNSTSVLIAPNSGPINTVVSITGTNLSSATATVDGITATVNNVSTTEVEVTIPAGATTGNIVITDDAGCPITTSFSIITTAGSCGDTSDLMITEVFDNNGGSLGFIEIYNGTGATIDLTNYRIERFANINSTNPTNPFYEFPTTGIGSSIADGEVLVGKVSNDATAIPSDFTFGGNTSGFNDNDRFELVDTTTSPAFTTIDDWHETLVGSPGFVYRRNTTVQNPNPNYDATEWTVATTGDSSNLGIFGIATNAPTITLQPQSISDCAADIQFNITATPGNSGVLTYQWKFNDGINTGWTDVTSATFAPETVTGETTNTLSISNGAASLSGYQFYCEVTEDGSCSIASDAAQLNIRTATWDGTDWLWNDGTAINTVPDATASVIINGSFSGASFIACNLTVNNGSTLTVSDNFYVEVINNVSVNDGRITTQSSGSFVQRGNGLSAGNFIINTNGNADVNKTTAILNNTYDYTYWSSPVENITVAQGLTDANPDRTYVFNANNFLDVDGDGVDDNGDAWAFAPRTAIMNPAQGFAAMHGAFLLGTGRAYTYNFDGVYNTGDISFAVPYDTNNDDEHWNLIGNPYPSAVDAGAFFTANASVLDGVLYMWSHVSPPDADNNGNEVLNFNQSDYITVNTMSTSGNGADINDDGVFDANDVPSSQVPSGQGFFISSNAAGAGLFTNSMRVSGDNINNEFYRTANTNSQSNTIERLWLNLSSEVGIYSQISIAYADNATDQYDGKHIDTQRNYAGNAGFLYSLDNDGEGFYVIQGKALSHLNEDETIKIGFGALISTNETYTIEAIKQEGSFLTSNAIYLKDNQLNIIHDLSNSGYTFSSDGGIFDERFEIIFRNQALSIDDNEFTENDLIIIEQENDFVKFELKTPSATIEALEIFDLQGRLVYDLKGNSHSEIYNLSNLSSQIYIVKATLSNGALISKKAIKK